MHTCHKHLFAGAALAYLVWPAGCTAQMMLSAAAASQIIEGCAVHAKAKGQSHAIAVYDAGGHPVALLRMDGNAPGITAFAMEKATAVALWHFSTANMAAAAKETPGLRQCTARGCSAGWHSSIFRRGETIRRSCRGIRRSAGWRCCLCRSRCEGAGLSSSLRKTDPAR